MLLGRRAPDPRRSPRASWASNFWRGSRLSSCCRTSASLRRTGSWLSAACRTRARTVRALLHLQGFLPRRGTGSPREAAISASPYLLVEEVAERYRCSKRSIHELTRTHKIPASPATRLAPLPVLARSPGRLGRRCPARGRRAPGRRPCRAPGVATVLSMAAPRPHPARRPPRGSQPSLGLDRDHELEPRTPGSQSLPRASRQQPTPSPRGDLEPQVPLTDIPSREQKPSGTSRILDSSWYRFACLSSAA